MYRLIWSLIVLCFLQACSSMHEFWRIEIGSTKYIKEPILHLHVYDSSMKDETELKSALEKQGYVVKIRNNGLPNNDNSSFVIYNLPLHDYIWVAKLEKTLAELGVKNLHVYPLQSGVHSYSPGNIGVYIL